MMILLIVQGMPVFLIPFFFFFGEEGFLTWRRLTFFVCFFNVRDVLNVAGFIVSIRASELR